ncbi:retinol-binding protein pinta-like isoform X2 [Photinus pyralis]|uniref:retinol-binding protein pinta-like isoform X2 n=1 Tax=Photinus pyralis TaxID=7054 RepID=UPI001266F0A0|nr:retinol-binding protein pinta-like isoform X2 [Photinus pyralis]
MHREISPTLKEICRQDLNEVEERTETDILHIRQWMEKQRHLNFVIDDQLILAFLRCSKFSLERVKDKIDNYYTMRTLSPELYENRDPLSPEIQRLLHVGAVLPLPKVESGSNCRIIFLNLGENVDYDTMPFRNILKLFYMVTDILLLEDDYAVIGGLKVIMQCKNPNPKYMLELTPTFMKKHALLIEKGLPFRLRAAYFMNLHAIFQYVFDLLKKMLPSKMSRRLEVFDDTKLQQLYKLTPQSALPKEWGGDNGSLGELTVTWKENVQSYRDWFLQNEKLKSNEDLRQGPSKTYLHDFDIEGSFRQLNID